MGGHSSAHISLSITHLASSTYIISTNLDIQKHLLASASPSLLSHSLIMGDLNAHHLLWYGHGGGIPNKDLRQHTPPNSIVEWYENHSCLLHMNLESIHTSHV
jgi:hypothetical protein